LKRQIMATTLAALVVPPAALADHRPGHPRPPGAGPVPPAQCDKHTAKMSLARATVVRSQNVLDVLAPITARASGNVAAEFHAASRVTRFQAPINSADGRIRFRQPIPAAQARLGTGILTLAYPGDDDTRPQVVRLRAASQPARLEMERPRIANNRIRARGRVTSRARGVVRIQLEHLNQACETVTVERQARIQSDGRWNLDSPLTASERAGITTRRGTVHSYTLFTGYYPRRIRGEMRSFEVLGAQ
jgi:hypothetical protein